MTPGSYPGIKRVLDVFGAALLLALLSPLLVAISLGAFLMQGRPIFFTQPRPGFQGKPFVIVKFRTMKNTKPDGQTQADLDQITKFGSLLRTLSLDELPQLLNVFRGDMSFVGPRPLLMEYLPLYDSVQAQRHSVRPGITGLAQARGRNLLSWEERFELDVQYVRSYSFFGDIEILWKSLVGVSVARGVNPKESPLMKRFTGSAQEGRPPLFPSDSSPDARNGKAG